MEIKRRQYYINPRFQARFIVRFCGVLLLGALLSICITMLTTQATLTSSFEGAELVIEKTSLAILPSVILTNVITTFVVGILVILVTLFISHKIAGPMYRFEMDIEEIAEGDLQKTIKIRHGDQFESVAKSLNAMVKELNKKLIEIKHDFDRLDNKAEELGVSPEFRSELEVCKNNIDSRFKLK